jgi:SAM-dependent methyltransferase
MNRPYFYTFTLSHFAVEYAPIKDIFRKLIRSRPALTKAFFFALDKLFLREKHIKRELDKILTQLPPGADILDAGFGYGQYSYYLAKRSENLKITALEIEEEYLQDFRIFIEKCHLRNIFLQKADLTELKYSNRFDLVFCVDVMEHIEDDKSVFRNIHQVLKPGGRFMMHTPHIKETELHGEGMFVDEHVRDGYSTSELHDKLRRSGFGEIQTKYTYGKSGALAWRLLQKYPISALRKSKLVLMLLPLYLLLVYPVAWILMHSDLQSENITGDGILVLVRRGDD